MKHIVHMGAGSGRVSGLKKMIFFSKKCDIFAAKTARSIPGEGYIQSFTITVVNGIRCLLPAMFNATATCRKVITAGDQQRRCWTSVRSEVKALRT